VVALQGIEQLSEISLRHPVFLDAAGEGGTEDKHSLSTPVNLKQTFLLGEHVVALIQ
jgi:hypothetical protein